MVNLPVRKCFHVAKVTVVLLVVFCLLAAVEKWRGGRRTARAAEDPQEFEWEQQILEDERRIIPGLGEGGAAAQLTGRDKELGDASEKKLAINVYLSERIAYNRTLEDHRNPACERVVYDAELPSASVIIIFHNEPYSVVIRTIWSVVNSARRDQPWHQKANFRDRVTGNLMNLGYPGQDPNSPFVYLKEIILVDDNSTLPELKGKLSHYVRTRLPSDLIRILRLPDRMGLTRARLAGARYATGDVLIFLDAHCEGQPDWLRPLLQRIKDAPHAVVVPIIDVVDSSTFYYSVQDPAFFQGLMVARMRGARSARGAVLIFLDAHCEAQRDWLRPLLQRVKDKRDAVVTPLIDVIDQASFQLEAAHDFQVGGFTFMGHYTWIDVPEREKLRRGSDIAPTWSPTMAGGLFAINREYYWELGAYDEQMAGWGGENLEMSFRIWQCGGTLETLPCSRVGHVFRAFHPYAMPANSDTHGINTARMAEVWMDDYKELFYLHRPDLRKNPKIGDVTHRKILREKLQCKSFDWYLSHVYKEKFVPVRDAYGYGRFRNPASGLCLDTLQRDTEAAPLGVYPCHNTLQGTQYLSLALDGQLRDEERCAELQHMREFPDEDNESGGRKLLMFSCSRKQHGQKWRYTASKQLVHVATGLCLDAGFEGGADARARRCAAAAPAQRWDIDYSDHASPTDAGGASSAEASLQRLRGQRRISRSLLAAAKPAMRAGRPKSPKVPRRRHNRSRKHRKVKRSRSKTKNKFILKLVRTLMNNSEEHLEVDIHCRHRQLYPNNSFVRDLVTILNEKNIKVINNGRVFERNRVTELGSASGGAARHKETKVLEKMEVERAGAVPPPQTKPKEGGGAGTVGRWAAAAGGAAAGGGAAPAPGKKRKSKPHAAPPVVINMQPAQHHGLSMNNVSPQAESEYAPPDTEKKIIIEDFVEVHNGAPTPDPGVVQRSMMKKKKKKHKRPVDEDVAPPQQPPPAPPARKRPRARDAALPPPPPLSDYEDGAPAPAAPAAPAAASPRAPPAPPAPAPAPAPPPLTSLEEVPMISSEAGEGAEGGEPEGAELSKRNGDTNGLAADSNERERDSDTDPAAAARDWYSADNEARYSAFQQMRRQQAGHDDFDNADARTTASSSGAGAAEVRSGNSGDTETNGGAGAGGGGGDGGAPEHSAPTTARPTPNFRARDRADRHGSSGGGGSGGGAGAAPLKVVMKSNLTFNLGDEFFSWRANDDVADILGELAIPLNGSRAAPPMHAWVRPAAGGAAAGALADTVLTAHGAHAAASSAADDDSSSSSESGDSEP